MAELRTRNAELEVRLALALAEVGQLRDALITSRRIGAAIGILMATSKIVEDSAFDVLRMASQNSNRKLRDVADDVLRTGVTPDQRHAGAGTDDAS